MNDSPFCPRPQQPTATSVHYADRGSFLIQTKGLCLIILTFCWLIQRSITMSPIEMNLMEAVLSVALTCGGVSRKGRSRRCPEHADNGEWQAQQDGRHKTKANWTANNSLDKKAVSLAWIVQGSTFMKSWSFNLHGLQTLQCSVTVPHVYNNSPRITLCTSAVIWAFLGFLDVCLSQLM